MKETFSTCVIANYYRSEGKTDKAIQFFEMAVDKDCVPAMYQLGCCFRDEESVKDVKQAIQFYKMAAGRGDKRARSALKSLQKIR
jgi:pentatricopeptide repeat protein